MGKKIRTYLILIAVAISIIVCINQYILFRIYPSSFGNWAYDSLFYTISIILWAIILPLVYHLVIKIRSKNKILAFSKFLLFSAAISLAHQILANLVYYLLIYFDVENLINQEFVSQFNTLVVSGLFIRMIEAVVITIMFYGVANNEMQLRSLLGTHWPQLYDRITNSENYYKVIFLKDKGTTIAVNLQKVIWFESAGNYVQIHMKEKKYMHRLTMSKLCDKLDPNRFLRVHRSSIINLSYVHQVDYTKNGEYCISLINNVQINSSRNFREGIVQKLKLKSFPN